MKYKAVQFDVMQTTNPCCWKWMVFLNAARTLTGVALTRADAVFDAEFTIDKASKDCARRSSSSSSRLSG